MFRSLLRRVKLARQQRRRLGTLVRMLTCMSELWGCQCRACRGRVTRTKRALEGRQQPCKLLRLQASLVLPPARSACSPVLSCFSHHRNMALLLSSCSCSDSLPFRSSDARPASRLATLSGQVRQLDYRLYAHAAVYLYATHHV